MNKFTAIILASRDVGEYDRIYLIYTLEQGLLKAVAKGVRKPAAKLAGHLEPGTLSEVYVAKSRGMGQITSAITLESFSNLKNDFAKLSEFLKISRFILKNFSEGEKDERIFEFLKEFLEIIGQKSYPKTKPWGNPQELVLGVEAFWWKLFDALGNRPEIMRCVNCEAALEAGEKKYFSFEKGGVVCAICSPKIPNTHPISDNQIKLLKIFWGNPFRKIAKIKIGGEELRKLSGIRENFRKYNY
jgi:DNA repair protein RecO (recombination protein O)